MATDEQWRLVEWDQRAKSACIMELRGRVEALEQLHQAVVDLNERFSLEPLEARVKALESLNCVSAILKLSGRVDALEAAQNLRQQDEDVERAAPTVKDSLTAHFPTGEELSQLYYEACGGHEDSLRAVYDLGRQHGAAANSKSNPNSSQIRSSAPTVGLKKMLARVRNEGSSLRGYAATDVIEVVADWLEQQREVPIGSTASADYFAAMLREEANR